VWYWCGLHLAVSVAAWLRTFHSTQCASHTFAPLDLQLRKHVLSSVALRLPVTDTDRTKCGHLVAVEKAGCTRSVALVFKLITPNMNAFIACDCQMDTGVIGGDQLKVARWLVVHKPGTASLDQILT
jgi:hypothetical protein